MEFTQAKFSSVARSCAIKVAIAATAAGASIFLVGLVIQNFDAIAAVCTAAASAVWLALLFATSIGGHFWGAVTLDGIAVSVFAWACCVWSNLDVPFDKSPQKRSLLFTCIAAVIVVVLCAVNVGMMMSATESHTTYEGVACAFVLAPVGLGALFGIFGLMIAFIGIMNSD